MLLDILRERLIYEPDTGLFRYRYDFNVMRAGDAAGRPNTNGHIQISINSKRYMAHNLAWLYMTSIYPDFIVDHKNRIYSDNSWNNLRRATLSENMGNSKLSKINTSGLKGVYWHKTKKKWVAQIGLKNKRVYLGSFTEKEKAQEAYRNAAAEYFGDFANV